jgi:zinc and cadmium transporter
MSIVEATIAVAGVQAAALGSAWALRSRENALKRQLPYVVSLAVGVLLATAILHLLPEAVIQVGERPILWMLFGGTMLVLFAVERMLFVLTGSDAEPDVGQINIHHHHAHSSRPINLLLASMLHSFVDGASVAIAFVASPRIGWLTAVAIGLHEIPHRMGDFAILVHLKVKVNRALKFCAVAGLPAFLGPAAVLFAGMKYNGDIALLLPISAGSFLYIATVNLMPELHEECNWWKVSLQLLFLCVGVGLVMAVGGLSEH